MADVNAVNRRLLEISICALLREQGFSSASKIALETLTEMLQSCEWSTIPFFGFDLVTSFWIEHYFERDPPHKRSWVCPLSCFSEETYKFCRYTILGFLNIAFHFDQLILRSIDPWRHPKKVRKRISCDVLRQIALITIVFVLRYTLL